MKCSCLGWTECSQRPNTLTGAKRTFLPSQSRGARGSEAKLTPKGLAHALRSGPRELPSSRLLCPRTFPGKTGVAVIACSKGSSPCRDQTRISCIPASLHPRPGRQILHHRACDAVQSSSAQSLRRVRLSATPEPQRARPPCPSPAPESTQTHVHQVSDAIQPSHPLSSPSPPAPNPSQHQGLSQWVSTLHQVAKVLEFQLQHQSFQWTPRADLL